MRSHWLSGLVAAAALLGVSTPISAAAQEARHRPQISNTLERFDNDADFLRYVREVQRIAHEQHYYWYSQAGGAQLAQAVLCPDGTPPPCDTANDAAEAVVVTGARIAAPTTSSITNVQSAGVDEGDIVKQIGQYLIVLQDGRLFVTDTRPGGRPGLALTSRVDVYRTPQDDAWYDEMLATTDRIVVTGYSYGRSASEINVFSFDQRTGVVAREATYFISSNDYYDPDNYATRLVNGRLVIYTPLDISAIDPDAPVKWPTIRRWLRAGDDDGALSPGQQLFDAHDIYRPIQEAATPIVHSVSVCPLGGLRAGDELACATTGFVGPNGHEFFVSPNAAYLWVSSGWYDDHDARDNCTAPNATAVEATVFRVPLSGRAPTALHTRGAPSDQFGLDASQYEFRALLAWGVPDCGGDSKTADLRYFHMPLAAFRNRPINAPSTAYQDVPTPGAMNYETRFTDRYVVYAGRGEWTTYPPSGSDGVRTARAVAVPVARPSAFTTLEMPHEVIRAERVGDRIMLSGYRDSRGLSVSLIDLGAAPRLADTRLLEGRYESEGRSHAFNSLVGEGGAGLMGLPTVARPANAGRWWWHSGASDVSFLSVDRSGQLRALGELNASAEPDKLANYACEVSCVDWYGNSRPIFIDGRVFALSGTEMIEGAVSHDRIAEVRRLNLTRPPVAAPRAVAAAE